ncbi:MAG: hypothetical protein MJ252_15865 [archaeon]|nr:hypothetical protein [archaeon]
MRPIPNPQSPITNPQSPINYEIYFKISISINIILMILGIFYIFLVKNKQNEE